MDVRRDVATVGRAMLLLQLAAAGITAPASPEEPPTQLRGAHWILIHAEAGEEVQAKIGAVSASLGYPDWLVYRLYSPTGDVTKAGTLPPGQAEALQFRAALSGNYVLQANPGQNAFTFDAPAADWVMALLSPRGEVNLISRARRLYFFVPADRTEFRLVLGGAEAATATVLTPQGEPAVEVVLPLYTPPKEVTVAVPPGAAGKCWSLQARPDEDLPIDFDEHIPPYLSERPFTREDLARFQTEGQAMLDLQPTFGVESPAAPGEPAAVWLRARSLALGLSREGRVVSVKSNGQEMSPSHARPLSGFFVRDVARGVRLWAATGPVTRAGPGWRQASRWRDLALRMEASFLPRSDHVEVAGELTDLSGQDRAISLYFALPVNRENLHWGDDIDHQRTVEADQEYSHWEMVNAGANGRHSVYPWACVAGKGGLAMGLPLDRPVLHRLGYNAATQQFFLCFDFALSRATAKFPGRAAFRFVLYPIDPRWGFRSACDRYYRLYPEAFAKRTPDGGMLCSLTSVPQVEMGEMGFAYQWAAEGAEAVAAAHQAGLLPLFYNDSMRYFIFLSIPPEATPSPAEIAADMENFLQTPDPLKRYEEQPEVAARLRRGYCWYLPPHEVFSPEGHAYLQAANAAAVKSAFHDASGRFIPTYYNSAAMDKQYYGYNVHTARVLCNPDPDLPGGYGELLLDGEIGRALARMKAAGTPYAGVALDNYFVNARDANYRREHFAYVDHPLTFAPDHRPILLGDFALYEWTEALARRLRAEGQLLSMNSGMMPFPFAMTWVDVNLFEWGIENHQAMARTLAYHKPVVTLPVKPEHYTDPWVRQNHLRFACFPGGYGGTCQDEKVRALYGRYVPVLKRLAGAGWEPLTYATTDDPAVLVERFGAWRTHNLCFTLLNQSDAAKEAIVQLDGRALKLAREELSRLVIRDLVDPSQPATAINVLGQFRVPLGPHDVRAVEVNGNEKIRE